MNVRNLFVTAVLAYVAVAQDSPPPSLTSLLSNTPVLSNLTSFVGQFPDLLSQLGSATNITILAPSNDAFAKFLNSSAAAPLASNSALLRAFLSYHVLNGTYSSDNISETPSFIPTLLRNTAYSNVTTGQVVEAVVDDDTALFFSGLLSNSSVNPQLVDVAFQGGLVHVIDRVLTIPANVSSTAIALNLTSAVGALTNAALANAVDSLPDVTIFIPNNEAFRSIGSALPNLTTEQVSSILQYHVVNGTVGYSSSLTNTSLPTLQGKNLTITVSDEGVFVNSAKVVVPDVLVANGVVHIIDNVLNPSNATSSAPDSDSGTPAFPKASAASNIPFTSGVPTPTSTIAGATGRGAGSAATSSSTSPSASASTSTSEASAIKTTLRSVGIGGIIICVGIIGLF